MKKAEKLDKEEIIIFAKIIYGITHGPNSIPIEYLGLEKGLEAQVIKAIEDLKRKGNENESHIS